MIYPICQEISFYDPLKVFALFAETSGAIFLDSAQLMENCGRYSFIALEPFLLVTSKNNEVYVNNEKVHVDPFDVLAKQLLLYPLKFHSDLPPFQGGAAGFLSYDLYEHLEKINSSQTDDMKFPDLMMGFYDLVIAFDNELKRAWIFSSGYPELQNAQREVRAKLRCNELQLKLNDLDRGLCAESTDIIPNETMLYSNFNKKEYCDAVQKVKNYILAGDIFEANISQRFCTELPKNTIPFDLYRRLRLINPAPFSAFLHFDEVVIASASPERFLKLENAHVQARPIKGTRSRGKTLDDDLRLAKELMQSEKDHAENVMIVDLLRNDLSRVCEDHSVQVPQLCGLESYATVHHLVSVVQGQLRDSLTAIDLLRATFPGGSITGAPKVRAMEIIAEIEPTRRGPYCGSVGYIGFNGNMDMSITIRTFGIKSNKVTFQAGGAIVLDSDPEAEYEETLTKAEALKKALSV